MLTSDNRILKIIDFGCALDTNHPEARPKPKFDKNVKFQHFMGTPQFMAPENIRNKMSSFKSDIWSIGCILYQLYAGLSPFHSSNDYFSMKKAVDEEAIIPKFIPEDHQILIKSMLKKDPNERPSIDKIDNPAVKYPFLSLKDISLIAYKNFLLIKSSVWRVNIANMEKEIVAWKDKLAELNKYATPQVCSSLQSLFKRLEMQLRCLVEEKPLEFDS